MTAPKPIDRSSGSYDTSHDAYRLLVESIVDYAIFMLDADGRVDTWNAGAKRLKGYAAEEIVGKDFSVFYTDRDRAAGKPAKILSIVRENGRYEEEGWRVKKDGTRFWANVILTALRRPDGELLGFAKVTRDLTARKESEEKDRQLLREQTAREVAQQGELRLRESEERSRALNRRLEIVLEGVAEAITVQDKDSNLVFANSAAAEMCGFDSIAEFVSTARDQLIQRFQIFDLNGQPLPRELLPARRALAGEQGAGAKVRLRDMTRGQDRWIQIRSSAIFDGEGRPELTVDIWHDVTAERKQEDQARYLAEATTALSSSIDYDAMLSTFARVLVPDLADWCSIYLLEGEELRDVVVLHSDPAKVEAVRELRRSHPPDPNQPGGVWGVLRSGVSEVANEITDELLERSTSDPELLAALREIGIKAALTSPIRVRDKVIGVITLVNAESDRRYEESDVALVEELGRRAGASVENAQLYRAAQSAAVTAERASRSKDEFLATVSHELRTPLNAILGWSKILKDKLTDPATAKPIAVIHRNAQAQVRIIDDILDVSRVTSGKLRLDLRQTDLIAITRDALEVVRPSAEARKLTLELSSSAEVCLLVADPERLQQVIWNLLSNSVKFTEPGGTIRVSVGQERSEMVLTVTDTGRGIDRAFLPFVFERFRQGDASTTRRVGGLGLGLSLVRHIVEVHGGRVEASSAGPDKGSTFVIHLPVRAVSPSIPPVLDPETPPPSAVSEKLGPSLHKVRVLVVDDEPDARDLVRTVLEDAGAQVEIAGSATEGLVLFKHHRPDVLVSDIGMPDEDGFSFVRRIRALPVAEGGQTPALALSAFAHESDRQKALAAGFSSHLGKPVDPDALALAVSGLVKR